MRVLELFCGTKSIAKAFRERGHEVFTVDFDPQFEPDLCIDILDFNIGMLPEEFKNPDVIWASPPCTTFSVASLRHYWKDGKPRSYKTFIGLAIVKKTLEIIEELAPKFWFLENPRGMLRKQDIMDHLLRNTVTYCQYGDFRMKPTDIWNNCLSWEPRPMCKPGASCHESAKRGADKGTQGVGGGGRKGSILRSVIPRDLCLEIVEVCEGEVCKSEVEERGR